MVSIGRTWITHSLSDDGAGAAATTLPACDTQRWSFGERPAPSEEEKWTRRQESRNGMPCQYTPVRQSPAAPSGRMRRWGFELCDSLLGAFLQLRGGCGDRSLARAIGVRDTTVERGDKLVQVRKRLLAVGVACR